jgi:hypothetical protein
MIDKKDFRQMPFTYIIAPILLVALTSVVAITYGDMIEEKELIVTLSCPDLKEYTENQLIESKLYFGHEVYLNYAKELYRDFC